MSPKKVALTHFAKVTMKGFPPSKRTRENLTRLRAGETLEWEQLEKIRSVARKGFRHPPAMRKVSKSFQSPYDKRVRISRDDVEGATIPVVLGLDEEVEAAE